MYKEYLVYKKKCETAQKIYDNIVSEKEELFISTQPKAVTYDTEKVAGGIEQEGSMGFYKED